MHTNYFCPSQIHTISGSGGILPSLDEAPGNWILSSCHLLEEVGFQYLLVLRDGKEDQKRYLSMGGSVGGGEGACVGAVGVGRVFYIWFIRWNDLVVKEAP